MTQSGIGPKGPNWSNNPINTGLQFLGGWKAAELSSHVWGFKSKNKTASDAARANMKAFIDEKLNSKKLTVKQSSDILETVGCTVDEITTTIGSANRTHSLGFKYGQGESWYETEYYPWTSRDFWITRNRKVRSGWKHRNDFGSVEWAPESSSVAGVETKTEQDLSGFETPKEAKGQLRGGYTPDENGVGDKNSNPSSEYLKNVGTQTDETQLTHLTVNPTNYAPPYRTVQRITFFELPLVRLIFFIIAVGGVYFWFIKPKKSVEAENAKFINLELSRNLPTLKNSIRFLPWLANYDEKILNRFSQILQDYNTGRLKKTQAEFMLKTYFYLNETEIQQLLNLDNNRDSV